jgi:hypothetical protein
MQVQPKQTTLIYAFNQNLSKLKLITKFNHYIKIIIALALHLDSLNKLILNNLNINKMNKFKYVWDLKM